MKHEPVRVLVLATASSPGELVAALKAAAAIRKCPACRREVRVEVTV